MKGKGKENEGYIFIFYIISNINWQWIVVFFDDELTTLEIKMIDLFVMLEK